MAWHKAIFSPEKDSHGDIIDFDLAASGGVRLVPDGVVLDLLPEDCRTVVQDGLLLTDADPFNMTIEKFPKVEQEARSAKLPEVGIRAQDECQSLVAAALVPTTAYTINIGFSFRWIKRL